VLHEDIFTTRHKPLGGGRRFQGRRRFNIKLCDFQSKETVYLNINKPKNYKTKPLQQAEKIVSAIYHNTSFGYTCIDSKCCQIDIYLIFSERPSASDSCCPLHPPTASWQQSARTWLQRCNRAEM
uniref:Uncharacterized protein n=1 Tax=Oryzias sinensis TaxID=183150 RepID=A0A8C7XQN7_9TELE